MMHPNLSSSFSTITLDNVLSYAARFHKSYGFVIIVLDHMSEQQSHIAQLTSQLYPLLKKSIRATDTLIRFTSDSWLICLDDCDRFLLLWTQSFLQSQLWRHTTYLTSPLEETLISVERLSLQAHNSRQAIKAIEHEIQKAKSSLRQLKLIRSTVLVSQDASSIKRIELLPMIHEALLDNRLLLAFQPVVEKHSQRTHYYECLARVLDKEGHILSAAQFISCCEKTSLIHLIDQKIQQLAIEELIKNRSLRLAINVSAITASNFEWLALLKTYINARPDLRGRLIIEITETSVFHNIEESIQFMARLRDLGCEVSIDDFGAGYMSLAHLKSDLVQTVKIDSQFTKNLTSASSDNQFTYAIIALAQSLGIKCVAEGVEDAKTQTYLAQQNIDFLQGYHIGKPLPIRGWV